jgi:hypothetical protein
MIKIFQLTPEPILKGTFENGILLINDKELRVTKEEVLDRFNRGYWRCLIENDSI